MEPFIGQLMLVGFNFAPRAWANCDGSLLPISQNSALFSLLGTIYGGDGRTTFALPDLRGRVPIHTGQGPGLPNFNQGSRSGTIENILTVANLPSHSHTLLASTANASQGVGAGAFHATAGTASGRSFSQVNSFGTSTPNVALGSQSIGNTGNNTGVNNLQPYLTLRWVIALQGIFPSRN